MTSKQPEAFCWATELAMVRDPVTLTVKEAREVSDEMQRMHAELETLRAELKTYEDLGDAGSDVQILRAGYAAVAGPSEAPEGWRNQFAEAVYADLEAADNQDVPLEEYPTRILKVLDSIVGPRHPTVIHWRNDAIQTCIAIAYKYCRDPESFQYLKQDLQALIFAARAPQPTQAQAGTEPLTDEQKNAMWVAATIELPSPQNCYLRGMADAERAHGIGIKGGQHV